MKWLNRSLITSPVYYGLCIDEKSFNKALDKLNVPKKERPAFLLSTHADATTHFFTSEMKVSAIVTIKKRKEYSKKQQYAMLVHEAMHIWQEIKTVLGEKFPSNEFEAYSVQAITQNLFYAYDELCQRK